MSDLDHENLVVKEKGHSGISIFDEQVEYWMSTGMNYTSAKNKAIDDYRKFGSKEVTVSSFPVTEDGEVIDSDFLGPDNRSTQDKISEMSNMFRKFIEGTESEKDKKYFVILLRAHGLDDHMDNDALDLMDSITTIHPDSDKRKDIAKAMDHKVKENGSTSSLYIIHNRIKDQFIQLFGGAV